MSLKRPQLMLSTNTICLKVLIFLLSTKRATIYPKNEWTLYLSLGLKKVFPNQIIWLILQNFFLIRQFF